MVRWQWSVTRCCHVGVAGAHSPQTHAVMMRKEGRTGPERRAPRARLRCLTGHVKIQSQERESVTPPPAKSLQGEACVDIQSVLLSSVPRRPGTLHAL